MRRRALAAAAALVLLAVLALLAWWTLLRFEAAPGGSGGAAYEGEAAAPDAPLSRDRGRRRTERASGEGEDDASATAFLREWPQIGQDREQDPTLGAVAGRVLAAQDRPPPEAVVETSFRGQVTARARAHGDGQFLLRNVPPSDSLALVARAPGHAPGGLDKLVLRAGQTLRVGAVYVGAVLDPDADNRLDVVVVDPTGAAVPGAAVTATTVYYGALLVLGPYEKQPGGTVLRAATDTQGRAAFERIPPGSYDVFAEAEGYTFEVKPHVVVQRDTRVTVRLDLSPGLTIEGRTVDAEERPVAGARVGALRWGTFGMVPAVSSREDGRFALKGLSRGTYFLFAEKDDLGAQDMQSVPAGARDLVVRIAAGEELAVRALDAVTGAPIGKFGVRVFRNAPFAYLYAALVEVEAADGVFRAKLPPSAYGVEVSAKGYALGSVPVVPFPSKEPFDVKLEPSGVIHGRVVARDTGKPVRGAQVFLKRGGLPPSRLKDLQTVADENGIFLLDGLPRRAVSLWISHVDHDEKAFEGVEPVARGEKGALPPPVEFALGSGGRIEGHVFGADHLPLAGADVQVTSGLDFLGGRNVESAADGSYAFRNVPAGKYTVSAGQSLPGRPRRSRSDVEVTEGAVVVVDFGATTGGQRLAGRVLRGEAPEPGVNVTLASDDGGSTLEQAATDAEGRFAFDDVQPGRYLVRGAWGRTRAEPVTVKADEPPPEVTLAITAGAIEGRVVDAVTGEPLAGAWVDCEQVAETNGDDAGSSLGTLMRTGRGGRPNAADGTFRVGGLDEGRYRLRVYRDARGTALVDGIELGPGEVKSGIEVRLGEAGTLSGQVRTALGGPVEGASIQVRDARGRNMFWISLVNSSSDGSYLQGQLAPGEYDVSFEKDGFAPATQRVAIEAGKTTRADFTLLQGGRIDVTVRRGGGATVADALVSLLDAEGRPVTRGLTLQNLFSLGRDRTDANGQVTIRGVAAGRYTVVARPGDGAPARAPVEAVEAASTAVELVIPE